MPTRSLPDATLLDLAATAVPPQSARLLTSHGFTAKRMDPMTGRALECLAHAIEYIEETNQFYPSASPEKRAADPAVRILRGLNRQIFAELPNLPERRSLLRRIVDTWENGNLRGGDQV